MPEPKLVYCKHMDADVYEGTCAMCTPPKPEQVTGPVLARMAARFESDCPVCDRRIKLWSEIGLVDGEWVHIEHTREQP